MYIRGILVLFAGILFGMLLCTEFDAVFLQLYFDAPSLLIMLIIIAGVITSQGAFKTFACAIKSLFSKKHSISAAETEKAVRLFKLIAKSVICGMFVVSLLGLINLLANLDDLAALGINLAIMLITMLYGLMINLIFIYPAINILETKCCNEEKP